MKILPDVDSSGVRPELWCWLLVLEKMHWRYTRQEIVLTSLRRPVGSIVHAPFAGDLVVAADLRRHILDERGPLVAHGFCRMLQQLYGDTLGVVLEPDWLTPAEIERRGGISGVEPHIHVQLKRLIFPAPADT